MLAGPDRLAPRLTRSGLIDYVDQVIGQARDLSDSSLIVRHFQTAGLTIKARFSDPRLADIYSARLFGQVGEPTEPKPDFQANVVETSRLRWPRLARWFDPACDRRCFHQALEAAGFRAVYPHTPRLWEVMSAPAHTAVQIAETVGDLPIWDSGAPLRTAIHWACVDRGWRLIHGATLGRGDKAVLIAGPGGAGKSGTTLAGIAHGLNTVGDDYVLIEPTDPPIARPVYRLLKQDWAGIGRIGGLAERLNECRPNWQGKLEFDPEVFFPGCMVAEQEIKALLVPIVAHAPKSRIEPIGLKDSLQALARSTLEQFPSERESGFLFSVGLSKRIPSFRLFLSEDTSEIAATIGSFIEELET